jgi:hypothetical protein
MTTMTFCCSYQKITKSRITYRTVMSEAKNLNNDKIEAQDTLG